MINVINDLSDANVDGSAPKSRLMWLTEWLLKRLWVFTAVTLLLLTLTTTLSLFARHHWGADLCANLRTQQVIAIAAIMLVVILYRRWRLLALSAVLMVIHFPWYVSAIVGAADADQPADMVVMVINVLTSNRNFHMIEEQIAEASPDALAVLEIGTPLARTLEKSLATTYPHQICLPQDDGNFGIALYSRHPLLHVERFTLNVASIESIAATISKGEKEYRIVATHPLPPLGTSGFTERNEHLQRLATRVAEFRSQHSDISMIVVGDLNLTPWSPLFSDLEATTGLTRAGKGYGVTPTWYADIEVFPMGLVLDHCLISDDLQCVSHSVGPDFGSDHRAVVVGLKSRK
jgi:endonuclease/exonuclease/phosphatase (EEP) superfamily protein YafD